MEAPAGEVRNTAQNQLSEKDVRHRMKVFKNSVMSWGGSFAFFGALGGTSLLLKPMEVYEKAANIFGTELPKIIRNQGADIATTSGMALLELIVFNQLFSNLDKEGLANRKAQRATALLGMATSAYYALEEATRVNHWPANIKDVIGFTSGTTRGDWGDVLAYSTPIIAGTIYLSKDVASTIGTKVRERTISKQMMHDIDQIQ